MFKDIIQKNVPLAPYTTYSIGGRAKYFINIDNKDILLEALLWAKQQQLDVLVLGGGSNILISDNGFDGLVIKIYNTTKDIKEVDSQCLCTFGAGVPYMSALNFMFDHNLFNLLNLIGIPGSVGGAVYGNAGVSNKETKDGIFEVRGLDYSDLGLPVWKTFNQQECNFGYRDSLFKHSPIIIWEVTFIDIPQQLNKTDVQQKISEILNNRHKSQPYMFPNAGCVFKNVNLELFPPEIISKYNLVIKQNQNCQEVPAGFLIEQCGLKGYQIGGAQVSEKHANFLINKNNAKSSDIYNLICYIKDVVKNRFGVNLEEEIRLIGF